MVRAGHTPFDMIDLSFFLSLAGRSIVYFCLGIVVSKELIINYKDTKNIRHLQIQIPDIQAITYTTNIIPIALSSLQSVDGFTQLLDFTDYYDYNTTVD